MNAYIFFACFSDSIAKVVRKDSLDKSLSNLCQIMIHTVTVNVSHSTVREIDTHLSDKSRSDTLK